MFAEPELGRKIIDDVIRLSEPFGTAIIYEHGIGRVQLAASSDEP